MGWIVMLVGWPVGAALVLLFVRAARGPECRDCPDEYGVWS